jgi:hypothetical protein
VSCRVVSCRVVSCRVVSWLPWLLVDLHTIPATATVAVARVWYYSQRLRLLVSW